VTWRVIIKRMMRHCSSQNIKYKTLNYHLAEGGPMGILPRSLASEN